MDGEINVTWKSSLIVNGTALLVPVLGAVTTTLPLTAPNGTWAVMLPALQLTTGAGTPAKVTPPLPCTASKYAPVMTTSVPGSPEPGLRAEMTGRRTVKPYPFVCTPPVVTTTGPVVAPVGTIAVMLVSVQLFTVAESPLKVTDPVLALKPLPVMVTIVPRSALAGVMAVIEGAFSWPRDAKVAGEFWLLYPVAIQSAERTEFEIRTSSTVPDTPDENVPAPIVKLSGEVPSNGVELLIQRSRTPST